MIYVAQNVFETGVLIGATIVVVVAAHVSLSCSDVICAL